MSGEWTVGDALEKAFADLFPEDPEFRKLPTPEEAVDAIDKLGTEEEVPLPNLVELIADEDDCAWDQECAYGHRVEQHAVYCHNPGDDMPRKCPYGWRSGGRYPDCMCPGFKPQPGVEYINKGAYI